MAKKIVTLYVDDTSLRLMVTDGKRIKEWAESPLEPGLIEDGVIVNEAEVAAKVKQLFEVQKVKTKKVIMGVSGLRCLTRPVILPQLPKEMVDEAVKREAKTVRKAVADPRERNVKIIKDLDYRGINEIPVESLKDVGFYFNFYDRIGEVNYDDRSTEYIISDCSYTVFDEKVKLKILSDGRNRVS